MAKPQTDWVKIAAIITGVIGLATILAMLFIYYDGKSDFPRFSFTKSPYFRPDDTIILVADNKNSKEFLDIEFDGFKFKKSGIPIPNTNPQEWAFDLNNIPIKNRGDGDHKISIGFYNQELKSLLSFNLSSEPPVVQAMIYDDSVVSGKKNFYIKAANKNQIKQDTIKLDLSFLLGDTIQTMNVPVLSVIDTNTGLFYFEFKTSVQGLPKINRDDPRYSKDFFGFKISDQAGNTYYYTQSYAEFMAPGTKNFGVNNLADIKMMKPSGDEKDLTVRVIPKSPPIIIDKLSSGEPPIILTVIKTQLGERKLTWQSKVKKGNGLTEVYRNQEPIGSSLVSNFIDNESLSVDSISYSVQQKNDNTIYRSNVFKINNKSFKSDLSKQTPLDSLVKYFLSQYQLDTIMYADNPNIEFICPSIVSIHHIQGPSSIKGEAKLSDLLVPYHLVTGAISGQSKKIRKFVITNGNNINFQQNDNDIVYYSQLIPDSYSLYIGIVLEYNKHYILIIKECHIDI